MCGYKQGPEVHAGKADVYDPYGNKVYESDNRVTALHG